MTVDAEAIRGVNEQTWDDGVVGIIPAEMKCIISEKDVERALHGMGVFSAATFGLVYLVKKWTYAKDCMDGCPVLKMWEV